MNQEIIFKNGYVGTIGGGKDLSFDSFFTKADYKGAPKFNLEVQLPCVFNKKDSSANP